MNQSHGIREVVVEALREMNYDVSDITDDTPLGPAGLDLESLAIAELAVALEDAYGLRVGDDDTERLALMTVGEFVAAASQQVEPVAGTRE